MLGIGPHSIVGLCMLFAYAFDDFRPGRKTLGHREVSVSVVLVCVGSLPTPSHYLATKRTLVLSGLTRTRQPFIVFSGTRIFLASRWPHITFVVSD